MTRLGRELVFAVRVCVGVEIFRHHRARAAFVGCVELESGQGLF